MSPDICPGCGEDPEESYRCQHCGADLAGRGRETATDGAPMARHRGEE